MKCADDVKDRDVRYSELSNSTPHCCFWALTSPMFTMTTENHTDDIRF